MKTVLKFSGDFSILVLRTMKSKEQELQNY